PRMFFPQFGVDVVVGVDRVVTDICGIGTINPICSPALVNTFVQRIWSRVRMISAVAAVRNQVAVVLKHIEAVVVNDSLDFALGPLLRFGNSDVNRLTLERFWLPTFREISHHPVPDFWIARVESSRLGGEPCLSPINPKPEL